MANAATAAAEVEVEEAVAATELEKEEAVKTKKRETFFSQTFYHSCAFSIWLLVISFCDIKGGKPTYLLR